MHGASGVSQWIARILTSNWRYAFVALWIGAAVAAYLYLPGIGETESNPIGVLAPNNSQAVKVEKESAKLFAVPAASRTIIVERNPNGLPPAEQQQILQRALNLTQGDYKDYKNILGALPLINDKPLIGFSNESGTTALTYLFFDPGDGIYNRYYTAQNFINQHVNAPDNTFVGLTGVVPLRAQQGLIISDKLHWVELVSVGLTALIVGIAFRSIGAPLLTLLAAGTSYVVSERIVSFIGVHYQVTIPIELRPLLVVLVLAICTDYTVFFMSGTRNQFKQTDDKIEAAREGAAGVIPLVAVAGLTVAAGATSLIFAKLQFLRVLGPTLGGAVLISLVVVVTFVPALLAIVGKLIFWPHEPKPEEDKEREMGWRERMRRQRPLMWRFVSYCIIVFGVVLLLAGASGLKRVAVGMPLIEDMPTSSSSYQASIAAEKGFAPGAISPTEVLVQAPGITNDQQKLAKLESLISQQPGVAAIVGPREQPTGRTFGLVLSNSGDAARYIVIFDNDPYGAKSISNLETLKKRMPDLLQQAGLPQANAGLGGDTAIALEIRQAVVASIIPVAIATALLDLILLTLLLRSLIAPIYLLVTSVLAVAAPLGLMIYWFQSIGRHNYLDFYVPVAVAVLLFSLGSDYNLFVVGRIWERAEDEPLQEAIETAGSEASHAIRVAAITLALSFAALAVVPLTTFREFAFAMAVGVFIDSFIVRSYIVPALISFIGNASFWPSRPEYVKKKEHESVPAHATQEVRS